MQQQKNQPCQNRNCQVQTYKNTKTGYCRDCYFEIKNQKFKELQKIKCKIEECETLISEKSKTKDCKHCYNKSRQKPEKNITFICSNPSNNEKCLKGFLVSKYGFTEAIKINKLCKKCAMVKMVQTRMANDSYKTTDIAKENISKGLRKFHEMEFNTVWNKGLDAKTDERVARMGKSRPGEMNPMFGSSYLKKWVEWYGEEKAKELNTIASKLKTRSGKRNGMFGKTHTDEVKLLLRNLAMQKLQKRGLPFYNKQAIPIIEQYGLENGYNFRHAENHDHGEFFYLKYFADGYDEVKNVWIEFDEKHHYKNNNLVENDIKRQNEIMSELKCKFIRIKYDNTITVFEYED